MPRGIVTTTRASDQQGSQRQPQAYIAKRRATDADLATALAVYPPGSLVRIPARPKLCFRVLKITLDDLKRLIFSIQLELPPEGTLSGDDDQEHGHGEDDEHKGGAA